MMRASEGTPFVAPAGVRPLRLLFSAYACEPGKGSEPGVGWRWALEAARLGHSVCVITRENNREAIERELDRERMLPAGRLTFEYFDLPRWARWWKRGGRGVHLYYVLWQWGAYRRARALHALAGFDAVQHVTFGVMRHPSFMGRLGIPCVIGPLGGAERAPLRLRRHFPWRGYLKDAARDAANGAARLDPFVRQMLAQATVILAKTTQSLDWVPRRYRGKAQAMLEIGIDPRCDGEAVIARPPAPVLRLLYVGRFLYWKGMGLGLRALAHLRANGMAATLTLIGQGPEQRRWQALARELGIADALTWIPWMPQQELLAAYAQYDALLFPSLHDSSGNVVLEAMAGGLPVVCLDLGGPAAIIDESSGRVVKVEGLTEQAVVQALARALLELARDAALLDRLRAGARALARRLTWPSVVAQVWGGDGAGYKAAIATLEPVSRLEYERA